MGKIILNNQIVQFLLVAALLFPSTSFAKTDLSLTGYVEKSNSGLEKKKEHKVSGTIQFGLFQYLSIGFSRQQFKRETSGKKLIVSGSDLTRNFSDVVRVYDNSVFLSLILYAGPITPYIFGGISRKWYYYEYYDEFDNNGEVLKIEPDDNGKKNLWNAGIGLQIPVSYSFSIKLKNTWSEGFTQEGPGGEKKKTFDTYTEFGVNYSL